MAGCSAAFCLPGSVDQVLCRAAAISSAGRRVACSAPGNCQQHFVHAGGIVHCLHRPADVVKESMSWLRSAGWAD